jgi:hypothetical protein
MKLKICLFFVAAIALASCVDIPNFSDTPTIYYNGIQQYTVLDTAGNKSEEKVIITIDFEDGDGDLGVTSEERSDTVKYKDWGNYELVTMTKQLDGKWTEAIRSEDRKKFMPVLKPDGKPGPIKGKLDLNTSFKYSRSAVPITLKFKVRIRDRAFHVSNQTPESDTVVVPGFR